MATNPSNSNAINIANLSKAQILTDGDLLIAETINGTQIIDFTDFNVVKTDVFGNVTLTGNVTGKNALFADVMINNLSASSIYTSTGVGADASNDFYDRFTIEDGIILSANQNTLSNPVYTRITRTDLPAVTASMLNLFRRISDESGYTIISTGNTKSNLISIPSYFEKYTWVLSPNRIVPSNFNLMPIAVDSGSYRANVDISTNSISALSLASNKMTAKAPASASTLQASLTSLVTAIPSLSTLPVLAYIMPNDIQSDGGNNLNFYITLPYSYPCDVRVYWRLLFTG